MKKIFFFKKKDYKIRENLNEKEKKKKEKKKTSFKNIEINCVVLTPPSTGV